MRLLPGWVVGVVPAGLVVIGPRVEAEVAVPGGVAASAALIAGTLGAEPAAEAGAALPDAAERRSIAELLHELGAVGNDADAPPPPHGHADAVADVAPPPGRALADPVSVAPPPPGHALADAVAEARAGRPPEGVVWTAEEALVLPPGLTARTRTRALRAFVAGLAPDGRLEAYALLARGAGAVHGDVPDAARLRARLADAGDGIAVLDLTARGRSWRVRPAELDRIGADGPHRLGPILRTTTPEPVDAELPGLCLCVAEVAVANLDSVTSARDRTVQGMGDAERARLVAHAEGAERFAAGELSAAEIVSARFAELEGAVDPRALYARDAPRLRAPVEAHAGDTPDAPDGDAPAPDAPRLWAPVEARDGTRRWAPAETVYVSVAGPIPWTGSGVAAGLDVAGARQRAFRELVERDAFMLAWLRRASRERVAPRGAPDEALRIGAVLERRGWSTTWVNLTLDTLPVILCCLTHPDDGLTLGAACDPHPAEALRRATVEAAVLALRFQADAGDRPRPDAVRTPRDHLLLHRDPARSTDHELLYSGADEVELGDIPDGAGVDLEQRLAELGHEPLAADLSLPACRPYRVVRALAPGLVPLTFGHDTEALGLARVRSAAFPGSPPVGACTLPHPFS